MRKCYLLFCLLFLVLAAGAQKVHTLSGKITNASLEPLAFVSIQVVQKKIGGITKEDGTYSINLEEGTYDLMISLVGYKPYNIRITLQKDYVQNIILEESESSRMEDVVIRIKYKDRSEEIVKNLIKAKNDIVSASGAYSVNMYIKAMQQDSLLKKKKEDDSVEVENYDAMAMAEVSLKLDYESDSRMREERLGVKKTGNADFLYHLSSTAGNFSFYNNLVSVPSISATPFLSPLSYSGLMAYKYKMIRQERRDGKRIYVISVKPGLLSNATVEGEMEIMDSTWALLKTRFRFPSYHLMEYDYFEVEQNYTQLDGKAWVLEKQLFSYYSKSSKKQLSGKTEVFYSNYELNKQFDSRHFGMEISATAQTAYTRDSSFWTGARTAPLTPKEIRFIHYQDSIYRLTHTEAYLDSLDETNNRLNWKKIALSGAHIYDRKKERTWIIPSLLSLYEPLAFGGGRVTPRFFYYKKFPDRKDINIFAKVSYGFRNQDINGQLILTRMHNPFNRGYYSIRAIRNFDHIYEGDAWVNQIRRSSYFLNNYFAAGYGLEVFNGFTIFGEANAALRRSVNGYKQATSIEEMIKGTLDSSKQVAFEPYNGFYGRFTVRYTPRQRYIREPFEKIILGSKWPTFYGTIFKGIPGIINSEVDFDYLEFGIEQKISFGLLGNMRYKVNTGDFLSKQGLKILEYTYQRRGDPLFFMNPDNAFQGLDSTFAVFKRFYSGHMVHEFNGAFINKIPLLKKIGLREIAGAGFLIAPERNLRYVEAFVGIEKVFKWPLNPMQKFKLGIYAVTSWANQFQNPIQFKIGFTTWDIMNNRWN